MSIYLRIIWCMLFAVVHETIFYLTLWPLGWLLFPLTWRFRRATVSINWTPILDAPRWLWLFGNNEDGLLPPESMKLWVGLPAWRRAMLWTCWRNPVNNLRFEKWLYAPPVLGKVRGVYIRGWCVVWQGWRTRIISPGWKLTVGFKYQPEDVNNACTDWRRYGCGFGVRYVR